MRLKSALVVNRQLILTGPILSSKTRVFHSHILKFCEPRNWENRLSPKQPSRSKLLVTIPLESLVPEGKLRRPHLSITFCTPLECPYICVEIFHNFPHSRPWLTHKKTTGS